MRNRVIYHIEFAKNWDIAASGGEICMLELVKYLVSQGEKNCILTTEKWKQAFLDRGLVESEYLSFRIISTEDPTSRLKLLMNYFKRIFLSYKLIKNLQINDNDLLICHSDFFPNSLPLYWLSQRNLKVRLFYFFHMKYPSIFRGYEWEFLWRFRVPRLGMIYLKLNQLLYLYIINRIGKGDIIAVNPYYKRYLTKKISNQNIKTYFLKIFGGVEIPKIEGKERVYDVAWMGRFHEQKGISEFFDVIDRLKKRKKDLKVLVIGGGGKQSELEFTENMRMLDLEDNIDYKGFLNGKERFEILSQAKIFLMTSYFEWRPIVMLELLKLWIPIVSYDLPVYWVYNKGVKKVWILNNDQFSKEICCLLENEGLYNKLSIEAKEFSKDYSWENTGEEIYNLMK